MRPYFFFVPLVIASLSASAFGQQVAGEWPAGGGKITIFADEPIVTRGMEFTARGENNTPLPYLSQGESAAPYAFFLTNGSEPGTNLDQVTMGALSNVTIHGPVTLDVSVSPLAGGDQIFVTWGQGGGPVRLCPQCPEPSGCAMLVIGLMVLGALRRRR